MIEAGETRPGFAPKASDEAQGLLQICAGFACFDYAVAFIIAYPKSTERIGGFPMKCAFCGCLESKVVDSRQTEDGLKIRRRRECLKCGNRFTTYEEIETIPLMVIKKDKSREPFDRQKLLNRLLRACAKRPVSVEKLEKLISDLEYHFANQMMKEVNSTEIGELVMEKLRDIDQVAYVRFASVYKEFQDVDSFMEELKKLKSDRK